MQIKLYPNLKKYALVSSVTEDDFNLVNKYRPATLKMLDKDGNQVFVFGKGKDGIAPFCASFGSVTTDGHLQILGDVPASEKNPAEYVADLVGGALDYVNAMESTIPAAAAEIKSGRDALIASVVTEG